MSQLMGAGTIPDWTCENCHTVQPGNMARCRACNIPNEQFLAAQNEGGCTVQ